MLFDLSAEFGDHFCIIIRPVHSVVSQLYKVIIAKLMCDFCPDFYKIVIDTVKLLFIISKESETCLLGPLSHFPVGRLSKLNTFSWASASAKSCLPHFPSSSERNLESTSSL
ncbi:Uncharacterised protein [Mycobacteroides abscessus subsp. abscessus]|nr:Uncharacterised protein [Mycobacteroides abscessus subsp. abscessus]